MNLTASKIDLARRCQWPFRADAPRYRYVESEAATLGKQVHAEIETTLAGDLKPCLAAGLPDADHAPGDKPHGDVSDEWRAWHRDWYLPHRERLARSDVYVERKAAIHPETGRGRLGPAGSHDRDYSYAPYEWMKGTADLVVLGNELTGASPQVVLEVIDWKTGQQAGLPDPYLSGQLTWQALAFTAALKAEGVKIDACRLTYVKVTPEGCHTSSAELSAVDLAVFRGEMMELRELIAGDAQPVRGPHCKAMFCPYFGECPATSGDLTQIAPDQVLHPEFRVVTEGEFASDEHAAWQWNLLEAAADRLAKAKAAVLDRITKAPLPVAGGVVRFATKHRESIEADRDVAGYLRMQLGEHATRAIETKVSVSKASLKRAVDDAVRAQHPDKLPRGLLGRRFDEVIDGLREAGKVKLSTYQVAEFEEVEGEEVKA